MSPDPNAKDKRKQAEAAIMRDMRHIQKRLDDHRRQKEEAIPRDKKMQILTEFLRLKRQSKIH